MLHNSEVQVASALHRSFILTWLLFLVHAGIGNEGIELVQNKKKMVHLVVGTRKGGAVPCPSLWPCNKLLKSNFRFIISQTNNG